MIYYEKLWWYGRYQVIIICVIEKSYIGNWNSVKSYGKLRLTFLTKKKC